MKLENKSVIVTGSGRGIGEYIAKRLAREGANVMLKIGLIHRFTITLSLENSCSPAVKMKSL